MVLTIFLWLISWWNVENLFDTHHDSLKNDLEYTPAGARHWTYTRYKNKVDNIARVICNMGGWEQPVLVGLGEVENDYCLQSLCYKMVQFPYQYIHYESPDERGIDVAALYDTTRFSLLVSAPLPVPLPSPTRDILYIEGIITETKDTLYAFFCHLPSMRGGATASEWKREKAKEIIQHKVDSIFSLRPSAKILVMGDMNCQPKDDLKGLSNLMTPLTKQGDGTHYYQGRWSYLDQCYLSSSLAHLATSPISPSLTIYRPSWMLVPSKDGLDSIPRRTYHGFHYDRKGFSDHLPIYIFW